MLNFGLLSHGHNAFVLVGDDYSAIKTVQFCLTVQLTTLCVDFSLVNKKSDIEINSENKLDFAGSFRLHKFLDMDASPVTINHDYAYSLRSDYGLSPADFSASPDLIVNIQTMYDFFSRLNRLLAIAEQNKKNAIKQRLNGITEFENYIKVLTGPDAFVDEAVRTERNELHNTQDSTALIKKSLYTFLSTTNLKSISRSKLVDLLKKEINTIHALYGGPGATAYLKSIMIAALSENLTNEWLRRLPAQ